MYFQNICIVDPYADIENTMYEYNLRIRNSIPEKMKFDGIIIALGHKEFQNFEINFWESIMNSNCVLFDVKSIIPNELCPIRL